MSEYRGRGRGGFRGRGGPPRGGFRGGSRGFLGRDDGERGGFRGRGRGGPPRRMDRGESPPPRKMPMMSSRFDSERPRGPPPSRRDRFDDGFEDRDLAPRSREFYARDDRLVDRLSPPPRGFKDRDVGGNGYASARGDFLPPRSRSPLMDSRDYSREERRGPPRDFPPRSAPRGGYRGDRPSREFREHPRDFDREDFRDSLSAKQSFRDLPPRDRFSSRDLTPPRRGPHIRREEFDMREERAFAEERGGPRDYPPREFSGRGGSRSRGGRSEFSGRGRPRDSRDDFSGGPRGRGGPSFRGMGGPPRGRGGPPRGRGRPDFGDRGGRRSSYDSRDAPLKRPRADMEGGYVSRR